MPTRTEEQWIEEYKKKDALWIHDENPKRPHALLTSGKHSNGFFNSRLVIPDEELLREAACDLVEKLVSHGVDIAKVAVVVGPQTGATKLAQLICAQILHVTKDSCFWASPAKNEEDGKKSMLFDSEELELFPGQSILLCEDVLTTGGSVGLTESAVANAGGATLPFLLVLVNRSGLKEVNGKKIIALIDREMPMWDPGKCPLCIAGSEAVRPKENWARLNASC
ncbi:MAG: phosphoribosyltransferase family protein [Candidatus Paceibacterota bacterium]|jgi:orotate phosphoribosyltransferase